MNTIAAMNSDRAECCKQESNAFKMEQGPERVDALKKSISRWNKIDSNAAARLRNRIKSKIDNSFLENTSSKPFNNAEIKELTSIINN